MRWRNLARKEWCLALSLCSVISLSLTIPVSSLYSQFMMHVHTAILCLAGSGGPQIQNSQCIIKTSPLLYRALKVFNKPMTTEITAVMYHRRRRTRIVARTPVTLVKFLSPGLSYLTSKTSGFVMRNHSCFPEMDLSPCSKRRQKSITILVI